MIGYEVITFAVKWSDIICKLNVIIGRVIKHQRYENDKLESIELKCGDIIF